MTYGGVPLVVPPYNSVDRDAAANAADESRLAQEAYHQTLQNAFGTQADGSVSPGRTHTYRGSNSSMGSALKPHPYKRKPYRTDFYKRANGEEYNKSDMKCAEGHIPTYGTDQLPFLSYTHRPVSACSKNGVNRYLVWDNAKSKYCCQSQPDSYQTIMERSLRNIYNMVTKSDIHVKSIPYLEAAIDKYLFYYDLVNNDDASLIAETEKMNTLKTKLMRDLSREHEEKSERFEREGPLTKFDATELFNRSYPDVDGQAPQGGGRSKKHKSKSRKPKSKPKSRKPKSKSKRTKSRKPKSRKSKRRY